ncbi:RNA recognition motif domain [Cinara cedri]|uniref:RNA recognition motif domain n=1 Tax=Cinara cedri TaxID=506608 RepID=A0A5E4NGW9_9HEMI|nr:RNA recognition motif domain [Cinara cedri]
MNFSKDYTHLDEMGRSCKAILVGNLHPKVSFSNIVELFYQVGPIEFVEFPFYDSGLCKTFACVVFKHLSSVEDSIKLFCNTKLYGTPIITVNYSEHCKDIASHKKPEYLKQLSSINRRRRNNRNFVKRNNPQTLPEFPTQNCNSSYKNEHNFINKIYHRRRGYRKLNYNRKLDSMKIFTNHQDLDRHQNNDRNLCRNQNYEHTHRDSNKNQDKWPVSDLRHTLNHHKNRPSERNLKNNNTSDDFSNKISRKNY